MQALLETIATLIAALTAAAFAQFGIDLQPTDHKKPDEREVRRTEQRAPAKKTDAVFVRSNQDC